MCISSHPARATLCGMDSVYTEEMRTIRTQTFPETYPTNMHCEWKIEVAQNKVIIVMEEIRYSGEITIRPFFITMSCLE